MPLVRITLSQECPLDKRRALADAVHRSLVETANVPRDDRFQVIEAVTGDLVFSGSYLGLDHVGPMVFIQITLNLGRSLEVKQALYARLAEGASSVGFRREDVIVSLIEVAKENWSFGGGVMSYPPAT
jgi:4-oxalocrotonate tautomerase